MIIAARGWLAANNGAAREVTARIASGSLNFMVINVISLGLLTQKYRIGARRFEVPLRVRIPPMNASSNRRRAIAAITILAFTLAGCSNKASSGPAGQTPSATASTNTANPAGTPPAASTATVATPAAPPTPAPAPAPPLTLPRGTRLEVRLIRPSTLNMLLQATALAAPWPSQSSRAIPWPSRQVRVRAVKFWWPTNGEDSRGSQ